jgi:hypothetical protein
LVKRKNVDVLTCIFCNKPETCDQLFCEFILASPAWNGIKTFTCLDIFIDMFADVAELWNNNNQFKVINMVHAAHLRVMCVIRNNLCFNRIVWPGT